MNQECKQENFDEYYSPLFNNIKNNETIIEDEYDPVGTMIALHYDLVVAFMSLLYQDLKITINKPFKLFDQEAYVNSHLIDTLEKHAELIEYIENHEIFNKAFLEAQTLFNEYTKDVSEPVNFTECPYTPYQVYNNYLDIDDFHKE